MFSTAVHAYEDWTNEAVPRIFYVGIGSDSRMRLVRRNTKHTNVSAKYGRVRKLVATFTDGDAAKYWEVERILDAKTFHLDSDVGCNFTRGGDGTWGRKHTKESREKMSATHKLNPSPGQFYRGRVVSDTTRVKLASAQRGKRASDSTKAKLSAMRQGVPKSEKHKRLIGAASRGHTVTEETRLRMSASQKTRRVREHAVYA